LQLRAFEGFGGAAYKKFSEPRTRATNEWPEFREQLKDLVLNYFTSEIAKLFASKWRSRFNLLPPYPAVTLCANLHE
jgi:hypothetical protein